MQTVDSNVARRRFIGSALSLGAGTVLGTTSFPAPAMGAPAWERHLVHDEIIRQMKDAVRAMRGPKPGGAARGLASLLRVLAAHHQAAGVDDDLRARLAAFIARDGREALLQHDPEGAMLSAEAAEWGVPTPVPREPFDLSVRARALDALLARGGTPVLLSTAAELTRAAEQLDRLPLSQVTRRDCYTAYDLSVFVEYTAVASCLVNPILCAGFSGAYWGLKLSLYVYGC